jgi:antitoxin (DNA-binding transcriptional repressor) of toxin-antitoxin stability system
MKKATVSDLRYRFPKLERSLKRGHTIEITKRSRPFARLLPPEPITPNAPPNFPDFLARRKKIFGNRKLKISGAELIRRDRDSSF